MFQSPCADPHGIRMLFKQQLLTSHRRWRDMNAASDGLPLQAYVAEMEIIGISFEAFVENIKMQTPFLADDPAPHPARERSRRCSRKR